MLSTFGRFNERGEGGAVRPLSANSTRGGGGVLSRTTACGKK